MRLPRSALAAALALAGCGADPDAAFPPAGPDAAPDPSALGPYAVGVRTLEVTDPSQFDPDTRVPRRLTVEVWYPAKASARGEAGAGYALTDFVPPSLADAASALGRIETDAVRDAPASEDEAFPLVLFSHGSGGVRVQSTFLTVWLASHGYVVAAPDHAGNTLADMIEAGGQDLESLAEGLTYRPADLLALIEPVAAELPVDLDRIGAVGHSFGAVTALRVAGLDPRIDAVVAQTPAGHITTWLDIERPIDTLGVPIMIQEAADDRTVPVETNARTFLPVLAPPWFYVSLENAGHFTYSDLCALDLGVVLAAEDLGIGDTLEDGCGDTQLAADVAQPIIRRYTVGLFNRYLRGAVGAEAVLRDEAGLEGHGTLQRE